MNFLEKQRKTLVSRIEKYNTEKFRSGRIPEAVALKDTGIQFMILALSRMESGEYDICMDCGESIGEERHRIVPGAIRCTDCQIDVEQRAASQR